MSNSSVIVSRNFLSGTVPGSHGSLRVNVAFLKRGDGSVAMNTSYPEASNLREVHKNFSKTEDARAEYRRFVKMGFKSFEG